MSEIRNLTFTRQRADFSGLRFGSIRPTDIDGLIEFENRCCIYMETKHGEADLPTGQRLALERVCDKWGDSGIVLVMRNVVTATPAPTYRIADLPVVEYRHRGEWKPAIPGEKTCRWWIERFASKVLDRAVRADGHAGQTQGADASNEDWIRAYETVGRAL